MTVAYVLMHSPLVGPLTWKRVAEHLPQAVVPSFAHLAAAQPPFWPIVAETVTAAVAELPADTGVVLVGHSNAGRYLPVLTTAIGRTVIGCLFVDASLPARSGMTSGVSATLLELARQKEEDGWLPPWSRWWDDAEIAAMLPDAETLRSFREEEPRLPLSYFEQRIPVPAGWDDGIPCGYLMFAPPGQDGDDEKAREARARGWRVERMPGLHLHPLVDPAGVAAMLQAFSRTRS